MNKYIKKFLLTFFIFWAISSFAQLDPANPPTDDLDSEEIQRRIEKMLPMRPGLLEFKAIHTFKFGEWPNGISDSGARFNEAFRGYSIKTDKTSLILLDKQARSAFEFNPAKKTTELVASDYPEKNIQFDDFCRLRNNRLVIADNSRNALLFFRNNKFVRRVGFDGERILFRHIDFVEPDRLGLNLAVFDSGRNRTYVFSADGELQWEIEGRTEPCFYGNSLIKLQKQEQQVKIQRVSGITRTPFSFETYKCEPGNIILDAWAAGTFAGKLAVVVYEGRGDEDHPDYAKLLVIKENEFEVFEFIPNLEFRLSLQNPYRLLMSRKGLQLLTARIGESGLDIIATSLH
jgi:hypothetical protein